MKRFFKLSAILLLLVIACCPVLLLSGCEEMDSTVTGKQEDTLTSSGWSFALNASFGEATVTSFSGTVYKLVWDSSLNSNKGAFKYEGTPYTDFKSAYKDGVVSGLDIDTTSATDGTGRTGHIVFGSKQFTITYTVSE